MLYKEYRKKKHLLQIELLKWQQHVKANKEQHIIIFEGRDSAGKTSAIKTFMEHLNPRSARIVALDKPTEEEKREWYFQRYIKEFPKAGEITMWDRSYYNRAGVEPVMHFCTQKETREFLIECPKLEEIWINAGIHITKFWYSITKETQKKRFKDRSENPLKLGKMTEVDKKAILLYDEYTKAKEAMFKYTSTNKCRWVVIDSNDKRKARLETMRYILLNNDYSGKVVANIR